MVLTVLASLLKLSYRPTSFSSQIRRSAFTSSRQFMNSLGEQIDPHNYSSGRWLRHDNQERQSRFIGFDFEALGRKVIELCPGAGSIASCDIKEGGYNRVLLFHTDNGKRVVARLPFSVAGPSRLTTSSEIATIKYLQNETSIPIPKILEWSDDASNAIGSEYILMEHAQGVSLDQKWPNMNISGQLRCIQAIYQKLKETARLQFPAYGSLYYSDTSFISASEKVPLSQEFCIGPHCGSMYWNCDPAQPRYYHKVKPNHGPWRDVISFCDGLIDTGISRIPPAKLVSVKRPRYHGSVQTHEKLLEYGRSVIKNMAEDARIKSTAGPVLFHPDLHKRNIFVSDDDPTVITAIIDWQSTSIEPAFWFADEVPDFAQTISDTSTESGIELKSELCAKAFHAATQLLLPKIGKPTLMDEAFFRPFRYCSRTWADGAVAFREELIQTSRRWKELGFVGSCPYPFPNAEEIAVHRKDYKFFEAAQQLKHTLASLLNSATDGWVPVKEWRATESAHKEMYRGMLQEILETANADDDEPIKNEADLREIWPFDLKD